VQQASAKLRFALVVILLAGTALFLYARRGAERIPVRQEFALFPLAIGEWQGMELRIDQQTKDVLGAGDFTERIYRRDPVEPTVDLFMAYFPSQRTGNSMHSPKNCLPGSGWDPVESRQMTMPYRETQATINRYIIARGAERQMVLYWYQAHDRIIASEYSAKLCLVADAIRMNRTDGALVRIVTPIRDETTNAAQIRAEAFARRIMPMLDTYIPN
jgi:EpsI family protein